MPTASMYRVRSVYEQWGDYGNILISGLVERDETSGLLLVERSAPFVPPISVAGLHSPVVVTDPFRHELAGSGLSGFGFQPVVKKRIVRLAWEQWDRSAAEPAEYPAEGEPENYVLGRRHNPELAEAIGPLWELVVVTEDVAEGQPDFLRDTQYFSSIYVSAAAHNWLAARAGEWLRFEDLLRRGRKDPAGSYGHLVRGSTDYSGLPLRANVSPAATSDAEEALRVEPEDSDRRSGTGARRVVAS